MTAQQNEGAGQAPGEGAGQAPGEGAATAGERRRPARRAPPARGTGVRVRDHRPVRLRRPPEHRRPAGAADAPARRQGPGRGEQAHRQLAGRVRRRRGGRRHRRGSPRAAAPAGVRRAHPSRSAERLRDRRHARSGARRDAGGARVARHARLRLPRGAGRAAGPTRSPGVRVRVGGAAGSSRAHRPGARGLGAHADGRLSGVLPLSGRGLGRLAAGARTDPRVVRAHRAAAGGRAGQAPEPRTLG